MVGDSVAIVLHKANYIPVQLISSSNVQTFEDL